jgi:hypothetical protein
MNPILKIWDSKILNCPKKGRHLTLPIQLMKKINLKNMMQLSLLFKMTLRIPLLILTCLNHLSKNQGIPLTLTHHLLQIRKSLISISMIHNHLKINQQGMMNLILEANLIKHKVILCLTLLRANQNRKII